MVQTKLIDIANLRIHPENPRFDIVSNQKEAIYTMIREQDKKLSNLAEDITSHGMNPLKLVGVVALKDGLYNVAEGNRRVTALKLLINPNQIPDKFKPLKKKFVELSKRFHLNPISQINCSVFDNESGSHRWVSLEHTGENDGVGVVPWSTLQQGRFTDRTSGKMNVELQIIEYLKRDTAFDSALKANLNEVKLTNLGRLIGDPAVRAMVGIEKKDGKITSVLSPNEIRKPLTKIIRDLLDTKFNVERIYNKKKRSDYIETFKKNERPISTATISKWEITSPNIPADSSKKSKKKSAPLSTDRKTLIPSSCVIVIGHNRINKIYRELKSLDVDEYENAVAVLHRVFIELSIDTYIESKKLSGVSKDNKLSKKIDSVTKHLEDNKFLTKHELKSIRMAGSNPNSLFSVNTFNAYVHNATVNPIPKDLKTSWDNLSGFVEKIWELI